MKRLVFERRELGIALAALVLAAGLWAWPSLMARGRAAPITFTVVPPDASRLQCRSRQRLASVGCGTAPGDLRPYVTVAGKLVLLAGVFESPAVRAWQRSAAPDQRVSVTCESERLGSLREVEVRFGPHHPYQKKSVVTAARVSSCRVAGLDSAKL